MIEVSSTQTASRLAAGSASSPGKVETKTQQSGNVLPKDSTVTTAEAEPKAQQAATENLEGEVASLNNYVQSIQRNLEFSVDKELERTVIKVVDGDSGDLIRQIPEDIFLELARNLKDDGELQLVNALG